MRKQMLLSVMLLLPVCATGQEIKLNVDSQNTSAGTLNAYEKDSGSIEINLWTAGAIATPTGTVTFWFATNGLASTEYTSITGAIAGTNQIQLSYTTNFFAVPTPGTRPWVYGVSVGDKTYGDGKLYIKNDPFKGGGALDLLTKVIIDWATVTQHLATAASGPVRPDGVTITNVVNADGSITIYAAPASHPAFTGASTTGTVTSAAGDAGNFLKADGTWAAPTGSGDITGVTAGTGLEGGGLSGGVTLTATNLNTRMGQLEGQTNGYLTAETDTLNSVVQRGHTVTNAGDFIKLGDEPDPATRAAALRVQKSGSYGVLGDVLVDYGLYGNASGDMGVYGSAGDDYGVRGYAVDDRGVYGESGDNCGVYGYANGSYGVYGQAPAGGYGGYFTAARTGLYVTVTGPGPVAFFNGYISFSGGVDIAKSDIENWNAITNDAVTTELDPIWVAASSGVRYAAIDLTTNDMDSTADGAYRNVAETDPVWTAASNTAIFLNAQYPNAVLLDGTRQWTGNHNAGNNNLVAVNLEDSALVNSMDGNAQSITNIVNIGFADGTVQTSASSGGGFSQSTNFIGVGLSLTSANNNMANGNNVINLGTTKWDTDNLATNDVYGFRPLYAGLWMLTYGYRIMDKDGYQRHTQTIIKTGGTLTWVVLNDGTSVWGPGATSNVNIDYQSFQGTIWLVASNVDPDSYINFVVNPAEGDNEMDVDTCFFTAIYLGPVP